MSFKLLCAALLIASFSVHAASIEKTETPEASFPRLAGLVSRGNVEAIAKNLTPKNMNLQTPSGMSLLHYAVLIESKEKRTATVACLLSKGISVNLINAQSTPLDVAEFACDDSLLDMLKKAGAKTYTELQAKKDEKKSSKALLKEIESDLEQEFENRWAHQRAQCNALLEQELSDSDSDDDAESYEDFIEKRENERRENPQKFYEGLRWCVEPRLPQQLSFDFCLAQVNTCNAALDNLKESLKKQTDLQ